MIYSFFITELGSICIGTHVSLFSFECITCTFNEYETFFGTNPFLRFIYTVYTVYYYSHLFFLTIDDVTYST